MLEVHEAIYEFSAIVPGEEVVLLGVWRIISGGSSEAVVHQHMEAVENRPISYKE